MYHSFRVKIIESLDRIMERATVVAQERMVQLEAVLILKEAVVQLEATALIANRDLSPESVRQAAVRHDRAVGETRRELARRRAREAALKLEAEDLMEQAKNHRAVLAALGDSGRERGGSQLIDELVAGEVHMTSEEGSDDL